MKKINPNDPTTVLISLPIFALATVGVVRTLEWVKKKWGWPIPAKKA